MPPRVPHLGRRALLAVLVTVVGACSGAAIPPGSTPVPSSSARPIATPTLPARAIEHATGATDLVLRSEEGGGFVAPEFFVTAGPLFSLYGDGTAIFRDPAANAPEAVGHVAFDAPYQVVHLSEEQIQSLLQYAIGPGGLAVARPSYQLPVADAPTTTFTITAGGTHKTVSVNGLGIDVQPGPDSLVLQQLAALRQRLAGFGSSVRGEITWSPARYRGMLMPPGGQLSGARLAWPWKTISPSDFVEPKDPNSASGSTFPRRTLTAADVALLGLANVEGGVRGIFLLGPDGKGYELALRPLLPDETT